MALTSGMRIGSYEIAALLGAGGMGEVYRARDRRLGRDVALKILPEIFLADAERLARFQREARTLASLNHPNIGGIYGLEEANGISALVLELVDGPTLADRIVEGAIPIDEVLAIAAQIIAALEAAHEQGIVHRDLKPANVKLRPDGTVKVLDFGLAKAVDAAAGASSLSFSPTITSPVGANGGVLLGTAAYMSPEQAKAKPVDRRADVWAFGCVLYEMLTQRQPFTGESLSEVLAAVLTSDPDWNLLPPDVSPRVTTVLRRCLEKNPARRIRDMGDVRLALEGAFESSVPAPSGGAPPEPRPLWRRAAPYAATVLACAGFAAPAVWMLRGNSDQPPVSRFQIPLPPDTTFSFTGRRIVDLSTDGRVVAFVANDQIYVRQIDRLAATPIRGTQDGGGRSPFVSPDGQWVGFWASGQLKRVGIAGGAPVVLADAANPWGVSWEPDDRIFYGQGADGIWWVSATGGTPQQVIRLGEGEQAHGPQLLPGGEWILFTLLPTGVTEWDDAQIVVQSLDTGERRVLISGGRDARYVPTGHLVYGLEGVLLAAPFDVEALRVRGGAITLLEGVGDAGLLTGSVHFDVAPTGSLVYVPGVAGGLEPRVLVFATPDGMEETVITEPRVYESARLSPDGTQIAVSIRDDTGSGDVWVWHLVRGTLTRLTFDDALDQEPLWSADGTHIVYRSDRDGGGLFRQRADGTGQVERLLQKVIGVAPFSWTADGALIFDGISGTGAGRNIGVLNLAGNVPPETLFGGASQEGRPALSPDGQWLAYESNESGEFEIYVRPFPDTDHGKWQVSRGGGEEPKWSRDGSTLFYLGRDSMMAVTVNAGSTFTFGSPSALFSMSSYVLPPSAATRYDIAPDGRFLLLKRMSPTDGNSAEQAHMVLVQNWFEELKRMAPVN